MENAYKSFCFYQVKAVLLRRQKLTCLFFRKGFLLVLSCLTHEQCLKLKSNASTECYLSFKVLL